MRRRDVAQREDGSVIARDGYDIKTVERGDEMSFTSLTDLVPLDSR